MTDFISLIAQVRRAMPRNPSVMALCDELERRITGKVVISLTNAAVTHAAADSDAAIALERLRATKRKAQKKWYHNSRERRRAEKGAP